MTTSKDKSIEVLGHEQHLLVFGWLRVPLRGWRQAARDLRFGLLRPRSHQLGGAISWVVSPNGYRGDDVRDVMLEAVEQRFGGELPASPVQWLSDNGSAYTAEQTRAFARQIGLLPLTTPVCSPQSNGMAESFVKTMKRDYIRHMPKPDRATAPHNPAIAFEHYNEEHPHSALKYRSPREFRRLAETST